jgi:uncharacterized protein YbjT (DUF2867 family)
MIVLTGASGHVGGEAARILRESHDDVRLLTRNPSGVGHLTGAQVVVGDYTDPNKLAEAITPGDRVFMVSIYETHDERLRQHQMFVDVAAAADVSQLVYLSFINASTDAVFVHSVSHAETEDMIRAAGIPFTFLRTSLYASSVSDFYVDGACDAPAGTGAASWVSRRDVGASVAAVLRQKGHEGKTYNLTGPEALTLHETSDRINGLLDLTLTYRDIDDFASLGTKGLPDPVAMKQTRRSCFLSIAAGEQDLVTDDIQQLTGIRPFAVDRHALNYPENFGWSA